MQSSITVNATRRKMLLALAASSMAPAALAYFPESELLQLARRTVHVLGHVPGDTTKAIDTQRTERALTGIFGALPREMLSLHRASDAELQRKIRARVQTAAAQGVVHIVDGWWITPVEADCLELLRCMHA